MNFDRMPMSNFFEKAIQNEFDFKTACLQISVGSHSQQSYEVSAWSREGLSLKNVIGPHAGYLSAADAHYWELLSIRRKIPISDNGFKCILLEIE